ncbi:hypothetical protein [Mitsuaria sp. GD03876]|uniref:hypothetical protein n=1 Tax=Mitsuaria sp. GD03876 TaxID=2975399 RepID=UPI00244702A1|nr:hypothetical protein [Mitsuaria sp. GD03876]MDH0864612.1 hypothetical protein [Mitsuaria sp. GD03876]
MTLPLTARHTYGFEPAFFDRMEAEAQAAAGPDKPVRPDGQARHYAPDRSLDPHAETGRVRHAFLTSKEGEAALAEWDETFQDILAFAREHRLGKAERELMAMLAGRHNKNPNSGPGGVMNYLRADYKQSLEAIAGHLRDERIPLGVRQEILNSLDELDLCLERQLAECRRVALELGAHRSSLTAELGKALSELGEAHLRDLLQTEPGLGDHEAATPHVLLPFAKALRLPGLVHPGTPADHFTVDIRAHQDIVDRCAQALGRRIDSLAIADLLADRCLASLKAAVSERLGGMTPDLVGGEGHLEALQEATLALGSRFGPLNPISATCLKADSWTPLRLADDARMLAIDLRHNMTRLNAAPPPRDQLLETWESDGLRHRLGRFEDRRLYVRTEAAAGGAIPRLRPPTPAEVGRQIERLQLGPVRPDEAPMDAALQEVLVDHMVSMASPSKVRTIAAELPTPNAVEHVIDRLGLDDDTLAGWMRDLPGQWSAEVLDRAFDAILRRRAAEALGVLLRDWRTPGFPSSWSRQVVRQAGIGAAMNQDRRVKGIDKDGDPARVRRNAQRELLDRIEGMLASAKPPVPMTPCRQALRAFAGRHPLGRARDAIDERSLGAVIGSLDGLRKAIGGKLAVPLLSEDGGLAGALESSLFVGSERGMAAELALIRRLAEALALGSEDIEMMLRVESPDRAPEPVPLVAAALLKGRPAVIGAVFAWAAGMHRDGLLDAPALRRILQPAMPKAPRGEAKAVPRHIADARERHRNEVAKAVAAGLLPA